ncbi:uncharacterized protein METZ01_LOCUS348975, partial [marine metagenome]
TARQRAFLAVLRALLQGLKRNSQPRRRFLII